MTQFQFKRLTEHTKEALLAEVRRVAQLLSDGPLTMERFATLAKITPSGLRKRFGGWRKTLEQAGLAHRYAGPQVTDRMRRQEGRMRTEAEVIAELQRVAALLGSSHLTTSQFRAHGQFDVDTVRRRFRTWRNALQRAGLAAAPASRRYTDEECFENLLQVWTFYGRPPKYQEMNHPPSRVGPKAYVVRWRGWNRALQAFVERVNTEPASPSANPSPPTPPTAGAVARRQQPLRVEPRDPPLGMRCKVLLRDRFRCVLCGISPATDPRCQLHVDHVVPYSQGGSTRLDNLRTLCHQCNLGRGSAPHERAAG